MLRKSEITEEAKKVINDVYKYAVKSKDKEAIKKAFHHAKQKENESIGSGKDFFIWREVSTILLKTYGKIFVK
jgi:formylmethanofuran dehydrogenase subunit E